MPAPTPGLVVFDLDGTLVDSRRDLATAANLLIVENGGVPLDEMTIGAMIGDGVRALVERAMAAGCGRTAVPDATVGRFQDIYAAHLLDSTLPYPGLHPLLTRLRRRCPLAVLTNKPLAASLTILDALHLARYFDEVIGGDGALPRKPAPEALLHLAELAGVAPGRCLMVGDSEIDFDTARAAGTAIALARYGYGFDRFPARRLSGAEILLDSPAELAGHLQ